MTLFAAIVLAAAAFIAADIARDHHRHARLVREWLSERN